MQHKPQMHVKLSTEYIAVINLYDKKLFAYVKVNELVCIILHSK